MSRAIALFALAVGTALPLAADQYWIAYEGNDFPENEGWSRYSSEPPAQRWLAGGSLFIDSRANVDITESYGMIRKQGFDPGPGETFIMRWRLKVHESHLWDAGVAFRSDEVYAVTFLFDEGSVISAYEPIAPAQFQPGVFHEFELRSVDMRAYELRIDGALAMEGRFFESGFFPSIGFGDIVRGGASLAEWDYLRFGVVPEPSAWLMALVALACIRRRDIWVGRSWRSPVRRTHSQWTTAKE
jgi:hypothetical protein